GGQVEILGTLQQQTHVSGAFIGHSGVVTAERDIQSGTCWDESILRVAMNLATQAARMGFWGPCGVDAFVYRDPQNPGALVLRPAVEFNARFTVGTVVVGSILQKMRTKVG